jgi:(2R)-sulfolactate sulfo-lyase subunit alpha
MDRVGDETTSGKLAVLVHNEGDDVAVAIRELEPGEVLAGWLDSERRQQVLVTEAIPLGHKVALRDLDAGVDVIEYGVRIAHTRGPIACGAHVHTHNVRSARWQQSA